ncbi:MAG: hypothetical protein J3Q66DRAFT_372150 [Benniella sp.]|nr:MAG: hypothetical protein J3Q66DRAFT_372150 [Benniella sp.]
MSVIPLIGGCVQQFGIHANVGESSSKLLGDTLDTSARVIIRSNRHYEDIFRKTLEASEDIPGTFQASLTGSNSRSNSPSPSRKRTGDKDLDQDQDQDVDVVALAEVGHIFPVAPFRFKAQLGEYNLGDGFTNKAYSKSSYADFLCFEIERITSTVATSGSLFDRLVRELDASPKFPDLIWKHSAVPHGFGTDMALGEMSLTANKEKDVGDLCRIAIWGKRAMDELRCKSSYDEHLWAPLIQVVGGNCNLHVGHESAAEHGRDLQAEVGVPTLSHFSRILNPICKKDATEISVQ